MTDHTDHDHGACDHPEHHALAVDTASAITDGIRAGILGEMNTGLSTVWGIVARGPIAAYAMMSGLAKSIHVAVTDGQELPDGGFWGVVAGGPDAERGRRVGSFVAAIANDDTDTALAMASVVIEAAQAGDVEPISELVADLYRMAAAAWTDKLHRDRAAGAAQN